VESLEERLRVRAARLGEDHRASESREKDGKLLGVPLFVEEVRAEDEIPRGRAKQGLRLAPAETRNAEERVVSIRVATQESDCLLRPVRREDVGAAERSSERRQTEPAAELEHSPPCELKPGDVTRERKPTRPQLGPVWEELVLVECGLVDERLGVRRPQDRQPQAFGELDVFLD
jgi:hypothetical protein